MCPVLSVSSYGQCGTILLIRVFMSDFLTIAMKVSFQWRNFSMITFLTLYISFYYLFYHVISQENQLSVTKLVTSVSLVIIVSDRSMYVNKETANDKGLQLKER